MAKGRFIIGGVAAFAVVGTVVGLCLYFFVFKESAYVPDSKKGLKEPPKLALETELPESSPEDEATAKAAMDYFSPLIPKSQTSSATAPKGSFGSQAIAKFSQNAQVPASAGGHAGGSTSLGHVVDDALSQLHVAPVSPPSAPQGKSVKLEPLPPVQKSSNGKLADFLLEISDKIEAIDSELKAKAVTLEIRNQLRTIYNETMEYVTQNRITFNMLLNEHTNGAYDVDSLAAFSDQTDALLKKYVTVDSVMALQQQIVHVKPFMFLVAFYLYPLLVTMPSLQDLDLKNESMHLSSAHTKVFNAILDFKGEPFVFSNDELAAITQVLSLPQFEQKLGAVYSGNGLALLKNATTSQELSDALTDVSARLTNVPLLIMTFGILEEPMVRNLTALLKPLFSDDIFKGCLSFLNAIVTYGRNMDEKSFKVIFDFIQHGKEDAENVFQTLSDVGKLDSLVKKHYPNQDQAVAQLRGIYEKLVDTYERVRGPNQDAKKNMYALYAVLKFISLSGNGIVELIIRLGQP